ncbi:hypothetical protein MKW98_029992 [Papaver atlanticum]|uniref:Ubiquitin carboxyl-terminal hydrolase n=1 Tax=Papaver atlanticum TaxID=357466 RepID=A0AAD4T4Z3_9MAGN|nr:hypothetical protein MKW98_029992 [Papaver atlanticum]
MAEGGVICTEMMQIDGGGGGETVGFTQRKIEFHLARKPCNVLSSSSSNGSDFHLETLNPGVDCSVKGSGGAGSKSLVLVEKRSDGGAGDGAAEHGLDLELFSGITFRRIGAGLQNLGNTCFLNSVLQCLTYTQPFAAYLQSGKHKSSCHIAGFCAMCAIQNHVSRALQSTGRILAPKDLVMNLRCISRNFRNSRQEDAHEYMVNLLESMHKCSLPSGVPSQSSGAYEKSLVHKIFGGRLRSQVKCTQCNYCSNTFDPFLDLSLEINRADSLRRALQHFTATEQLDGGEKHYQCQRCKQKVRALKQLTVDKAPYVLSVHLKRFGSHVQGQKINKNVEFGSTLDLRPYYSGPHQGDLKYTLYGVLVHAGWSTRSGHYYCFVRTSTGMWHSLDDNTVRQVSEKVVLQQKAYMLFYVRDVKSLAPMKPNNAMRKENMMAGVVGKRDNLVPKAGLKENISNGPSMNQASLHQNKIQEMAKSSPSLKDPLRQVSNKDLPNGPSTSHSTGVNNVTKDLLESALSGDKKIASPADKVIASTLEHKVANSGAEVIRESSSQGSDKDFRLSNAAPLNCNGLQKSSVTREVGVDGKLATGNSCTRVSSLETENAKLVAPSPQVGDKNNQVKGIVSETSSKDKLFPKQTEPALKVKENGSMKLGGQLAMANGCDPKKSVDSKHRPNNLKPKKKLMKSRRVSLHLGSKLMLKASLKKKKLKKKSRKTSEIRSGKQKDNSSLGSWISDLKIEEVVKDCNGDSNITKDGEVRERAFVNASVSLHLDSKPMLEASVKKKKLKKKSRKTSEVDLNTVHSGKQEDNSSLGSWVSGLKLEKVGKDCNGDSNIIKDGEIRERAFENAAVLATENSSKRTSILSHEATKCDAREPNSSREKTSNKSQQTNMLTRGLNDYSVDTWDEGAPRSSYAPVSKPAESIGYLPDEWDEAYDQGKRKKVREKKNVFGEPNPFQHHYDSKNAHPNKKARMDKNSSASQPYRIPKINK